MKSLYTESNISWFILLCLFRILLTHAMEENKTKINTYSVNQLQNDFIGLRKKPQKYVEFQLDAEKTEHPDASGLYELLPYYQKINPLGEISNYAIQWCDFEKQWQLIKVNPLGDLRRLELEETHIATLLEGDQFSRPTHADIIAYTTYDEMKSVVKTVGEINKELKVKIIKMEEGIASAQEKYEKLEEKLIAERIEQKQKCKAYVLEQNQKSKRLLEQNQKFKVYALDQKHITEKVNEQIKMKTVEYEKILEEIVKLTSKLKKKEIQIETQNVQIEKQNEENRALEYQKGYLSYKLSDASEFKEKFLSLGKKKNPLPKTEIAIWKDETPKNPVSLLSNFDCFVYFCLFAIFLELGAMVCILFQKRH